MRPSIVLSALPLLALLSAGSAAAQAPAPFRLPWDKPAKQGGAQIEAAGFRPTPHESARYLQKATGGFQRVAADTTTATYTRESGGVTESVLLRSSGGSSVQLVYSAVGDSATLQARLDEIAADAAGKLGAGSAQRGSRIWQPDGTGRLAVPQRPSRLPQGTFQFMVVFYRP